METVLIENVLSNGPKDSSTPKVPLERHERNTLHILQESATRNVSLTGGKEFPVKKKDDHKPRVKVLFDNKSSSSSSTSQSVKIYEDSHSAPENGCSMRCSRSIQTDDALLESYIQNKQFQNVNMSTDSGHLSGCFDQEAYDLLVNENIPENYWKDLAEQRRQALNDTLEENEKLSVEVEQLKEENRRLSDIAAKAEQLENLLQDVLSEDAESEDQPDKAESKPETDSGRCSLVESTIEEENDAN